MRFFVLVASDFCVFPAHMCNALHDVAENASFIVANAGGSGAGGIFADLIESGVAIESVHDINGMESDWVTGGDADRLAYYTDILGSDAINRILVSDRHLGGGYVSCGYIPEVPFMRLCKTDRDRECFLVSLLDYLFDTLKTKKVDVVLNYAVAGAFTMACHYVCEHLGIEYRRFNHTRVEDWTTFDKTPEAFAPHIGERYRSFLAGESVPEKVMAEARKLVGQFIDNPVTPRYQLVTVEMLRNTLPLKSLAALLALSISRKEPEHLRMMYPFAQLKFLLRRIVAQVGAIVEHKKKEQRSLDKPFAYYPLHFDPEASTMVMAPLMTNQFAVIEALSKSIPPHWNLVIKEHSIMLGRRPPGFYKTLRKIPKVVLASPFDNQFEYMQKAEAICTITGTAGWESMLLGKVPLFMGMNHFQQMGEGVVQCTDLTKLPDAIREVADASPASREHLELFMAAMIHESFVMPSEFLGETCGVAGISAREPARVAAENLLESLGGKG